MKINTQKIAYVLLQGIKRCVCVCGGGVHQGIVSAFMQRVCVRLCVGDELSTADPGPLSHHFGKNAVAIPPWKKKKIDNYFKRKV